MVVRPDLALRGYDIAYPFWAGRAEARTIAEAQPQRRAIRDAALEPAALLLCARGRWQEACASGPAREAFHEELRDLWRREREFGGDRFDVHTILLVLGSGCFPGATWADAITPAQVGQLVREYEEATPDLHVSHVNAARRADCFLDLMRRELLHLSLDEYVRGGRGEGFCGVVEEGTADYIPLRLRDASAHEVVREAGGGYCIHGREGCSSAEAEQVFMQEVRPRLEELSAAARAFADDLPAPALTATRLKRWRPIDAKTFCLLVSGLDYEKARDRLVGVLDRTRLGTLSRLLRAEPMEIHRLSDFVEVQRLLGAALGRLTKDRPTAYGLGRWSTSDDCGKLLCALLEGGPRSAGADEPEDEARSDAAAAITSAGASHGIPEPPGAGWEALLERLDEEAQVAARLLRTRWNVVLHGPPGTGKTTISAQIAQAWRAWQGDEGPGSNEGTVEQVTFHPSYGYEEFIEAYRPDEQEPGRYKVRDGLLSQLAERAAQNPSRRYLLLIDELNRGEVARIFGELITVIEPDKRGPVHARRRMYSGRPLWLPENLCVLGTMNTADKNVSLLDVAVRRRFAFVHTPPRPELLDARRGLVDQVGAVRLADLLRALNERLLGIGVPPDRLLGHAQLWVRRDSVDDPIQAVAERLRRDIIPLIEEYCFSDRGQMEGVLGRLVDDHGRPRAGVLDAPEVLLAALAELIGERSFGAGG